MRKRNKILKEIEDEKKREEFRLEKDRLEEIKKKKSEEKEAKNQKKEVKGLKLNNVNKDEKNDNKKKSCC